MSNRMTTLMLLIFATGPLMSVTQTVTPRMGRPIILRGTNSLSPQDIAPNLAVSNVTPGIGRPGITPAMPNPGAPAIVQTQGFTTAIGQQGFGGAIGKQGFGTAIGQQGFGTAIGQQGVGTAILPPTNVFVPGMNAIVIGQPEPFTPAPAIPPPTGLTSNIQNRFGQRVLPSQIGGLTNSAVRPAPPTQSVPANRPLTPTGHR